MSTAQEEFFASLGKYIDDVQDRVWLISEAVDKFKASLAAPAASAGVEWKKFAGPITPGFKGPCLIWLTDCDSRTDNWFGCNVTSVDHSCVRLLGLRTIRADEIAWYIPLNEIPSPSPPAPVAPLVKVASALRRFSATCIVGRYKASDVVGVVCGNRMYFSDLSMEFDWCFTSQANLWLTNIEYLDDDPSAKQTDIAFFTAKHTEALHLDPPGADEVNQQ